MGFDIEKAYADGLIGCKDDPEADKAFAEYIRSQGGDPIGGDVIYEWGLKDIGKGKLTTTWCVVEKVFPGCWPGAAQDIGDCFPAGTMVSMADGSKRPIEQVRVGEIVLSHTGTPRVVTDTIRKPFSGELVKLRAKGSPHYVSATPDHRFVTVNDTAHWCPIELLGKGDLVSLPRHDADGEEVVFDLGECPAAVVSGKEGRHMPCSSENKIRWHASKSEVNRYIRLDERLGWLVGLYLAEGSCDMGRRGPSRITFNLNKNETLVAETVATYIKDIFGVEAKICQVPSKPSVLYVRITCGPLAWLFKKLAPGNTYTKRLCRSMMMQRKSVRLAVLRGWFTGDGSLNTKRRTGRSDSRWSHFRASGVSVSGGLVEDMFDLANSCHLVASVCFRRPRKSSRAASNLLLNGANAAAVFPDRLNECRIDLSRSKTASAHGMLKPVDSVERVPFSGDVFCLEVAGEHSFIANGYAVHNCVSHGCKNACLTTLACEICDAKADEVTGRIEGAPEISEEGLKEGALSTEAIYWWRGHGGANGWICSEAAKQVTTNAGLWPRRNYPEIGIDLTTYSGSKATKWGGSPPPENVAKIGREHLIRTATKVEGREQVRDFLAAGFGVFNCSGLGFSRTRDEFGVSRQSGSWAHSQSLIGFDDRPEIHEEYGQALVLWMNSWGKWNSGGRKVRGTDLEIPEGSFWALAETIDRCSCFALSSVAGWPRRKMPNFGAKGNI